MRKAAAVCGWVWIFLKMKKVPFVLLILLGFPALVCPAVGKTVHNPEPLTAIDILLEPDAAMLAQAKADNARLLKDDPQGFALDATHVPHISVLQCYVRAQDLDRVIAAVRSVKDPAGMELETAGYFYVPWQGKALAGIVVAPTPELLRYQQAIINAIGSFIAKGGSAEAFVPNEDRARVGDAIVDYVGAFTHQQIGALYGPHVTIGFGRTEYLDKLIAAPYRPFTFMVRGAAVYQLGDYGAARKRLWPSEGARDRFKSRT